MVSGGGETASTQLKSKSSTEMKIELEVEEAFSIIRIAGSKGGNRAIVYTIRVVIMVSLTQIFP